MENTKKEKYEIKVNMKFLLLGLLFSAATVWMVFNLSQFFWIGLPFSFTFLAKSIDAL
ncbi:MAG TPA: hypothetical protein PK511_05260 [Chitinophagales bacterium]|nr:hypothetical protein [Chitinophagales bacterium]HMU70146.1 hypothetical protein [Chitinophagales bacterium]HMX04954.1 hypothetical protein [Chitinophagales bacterium]HMZ88654.1 hypothetical protein [Chitinophagales bacterium]HNA57043.1 hypothetical protein [Chitinophagales bacterium]